MDAHAATPNSETSKKVSAGSLNGSETTESPAQMGMTEALSRPDASRDNIVVSK